MTGRPFRSRRRSISMTPGYASNVRPVMDPCRWGHARWQPLLGRQTRAEKDERRRRMTAMPLRPKAVPANRAPRCALSPPRPPPPFPARTGSGSALSLSLLSLTSRVFFSISYPCLPALFPLSAVIFSLLFFTHGVSTDLFITARPLFSSFSHRSPCLPLTALLSSAG